jgi:septum formation protein
LPSKSFVKNHLQIFARRLQPVYPEAGSEIFSRYEYFMNKPSFILASNSPRRLELLRQLGLEFQAVPSEVSEVHHGELTAREVASINAYRKARVVAKKYPDSVVLGADTVVLLGNSVYGKPPSLEAAYEMLEHLAGRTHEVITAVCLLHLRSHRQRIFADRTSVTFHPLDAVKIRRYLTRVNPLDKAGAYAIQEQNDEIVAKISGSYTNVVGLPLEKLKSELQAWNNFPAPWEVPLNLLPSQGVAHGRKQA